MVLLRTSEQRGEMVCSKSYHLSVTLRWSTSCYEMGGKTTSGNKSSTLEGANRGETTQENKPERGEKTRRNQISQTQFPPDHIGLSSVRTLSISHPNQPTRRTGRRAGREGGSRRERRGQGVDRSSEGEESRSSRPVRCWLPSYLRSSGGVRREEGREEVVVDWTGRTRGREVGAGRG